MKKLPRSTIASIILVIVVIISYIIEDEPKQVPVQTSGNIASVHFIDVGQGDSTLIQSGGQNMLIDCGEYEYVDKVIDYLNSHGVKKLDYIVATHPHSDHMGGMATIIREFPVGNFVMPKATNNTTSFEKMLESLKEKGIKAHSPVVGETFHMGEAQFDVLAPNSTEYENLNNFSVVLKMTYGNHRFLFTGDAEKLSENEMLDDGLDLKADFLKVGHHGSNTSSSAKFLDAVAPHIAIISLGLNNDYGHPHEEVVKRLEERNIQIMRTDRLGDIAIETDGESYRFLGLEE